MDGLPFNKGSPICFESNSILSAHENGILTQAFPLQIKITIMGKRSFGKGKLLGIYKILESSSPYPRLQAYKARDLDQQRIVCLLTPADAAARSPSSLQKIRDLAEDLRKIKLPGISRVYDHFEIDGVFLIATEYMPGANLETILQRMYQQNSRPRFDEALGIFRQLVTSLIDLEQRGVSSRSLNANWIYFRPESCLGMPFSSVLTDPGVGFLPIARARNRAKTPVPEIEDGDVTKQIEKLGVLLCRLLTGKTAQEDSRELSRLAQDHPGIPESVTGMLDRMLAKKQGQRYDHLSEIAEALGEVDSQITQISSGSGMLSRPESLMGYYLDSLLNERSGNIVAPADHNESDKIQIIGPGIGKQIVPINREGMTVGRVMGNDIVLNDLLVSRLHARILYDNDTYQVVDLNSTNGTFLGDQKLLPGVAENWRPGTPLRVGDTVLRLLPGKDS